MFNITVTIHLLKLKMYIVNKKKMTDGHLAGLVGRVCGSWSWVCELEPHAEHRDYFKKWKKKLNKNCKKMTEDDFPK